MSRQSTRVDASVPTTSARIDQDVSQYPIDPLSPTMVKSVQNLARHLAVRLNLEPARLHQEIASFHALHYHHVTQLETAQASPRQEHIVRNDHWKNEHTKVEPYPAQPSESQGHNRSFSFQRGDDPGFVMSSKLGAEVYGTQRLMSTCLPGVGKSCRKQDRAPMTPLLISHQQRLQIIMRAISFPLTTRDQPERIESFPRGPS